VPVSFARHLLTATRSSRAAQSAALAALVLLLGSRNLETAVANGDTRTITLHHIHTEEDITITFKRNGRYDEDALKKLNWFVRDWRKEEEIHMDPRLFDLVWEVSQEVAGDKTIHIVCGYRSPATNAMLRRRSSGVAQFSQHTLGKAMDFYIPGASLEELRYAGLRLQRGGVGYYPSSGSPFVHLDVGPVRHWPRMTHDQLAHVFPNGRTVHVPTDGRPLSGYAVALADIEKRGGSLPSQTSLNAARGAGVDTPVAHQTPKKSLLATLLNKDDEEETEAADSASPPAASRRGTFNLASAESKPVRTAMVPTVPVPTARPSRPTPTPVAATPVAATPVANDAPPQALAFTAAPPAGRDDWTFAGLSEPPRPPAAVPAPAAPAPDVAASTAPTSTPSTMPSWPMRAEDNDHVPLEMALAYAAQPQRDAAPAARPEPMGDITARAPAPPAKTAALPRDIVNRDTVSRDNVTAVPKKNFVRPAAVEPVVRAKPVIPVAYAGMRYDDPWLRAMILAPNLSDSMTATLYGEPDLTELRALMNKPTTSVAMTFSNDPYPGISADRFSGEAVVFLTTFAFPPRRTAMLR
jgi:uncharacterized protein YcbK (DUF882 family)